MKLNDQTILGTQNEDKARHIDEEFKKHLLLCQGVKSELKGVQDQHNKKAQELNEIVETLKDEVSQHSQADSTDDRVQEMEKQVKEINHQLEQRIKESEDRITIVESRPLVKDTEKPKERVVDDGKIKKEMEDLKRQFEELSDFMQNNEEDLSIRV